MADRQEFRVTRSGNVQGSIPAFTVEGKITDSQTGATLYDFTGARSIRFPQVMAGMTSAQRDEFVDAVVDFLVRATTGY